MRNPEKNNTSNFTDNSFTEYQYSNEMNLYEDGFNKILFAWSGCEFEYFKIKYLQLRMKNYCKKKLNVFFLTVLTFHHKIADNKIYFKCYY